MKRNRLKHTATKTAGFLMAFLLTVPVLAGAVQAEEQTKAGTEEAVSVETEAAVPESGGTDFRSKRLLLATGDESLVAEDDAVISSYEGVYLLQYEDEESAKEAYAYYADRADLVEADSSIRICADAEAEEETEEAVMTEEENPFTELEAAKEAGDPGTVSYDIALIDTGADEAHVKGAVSMIGEDVSDGNGHGSRMAAFMAAENEDVSILSIKAIGSDGRGSISAVYAAVEYAISQDVRIISLSASAKAVTETAVLKEAVKKAADLGIVFVGAAGNNGEDAAGYIPGGIKEAWITGACDSAGNRLPLSNFGETVDYYLPAENTSEAAARFSGWLSANGFEKTAEALEQGILFTAAPEEAEPVTEPETEEAEPAVPGGADSVEKGLYRMTDPLGYPVANEHFVISGSQKFYSYTSVGDGDMIFYTTINGIRTPAYCIDHGKPNPTGQTYTVNSTTSKKLGYIMHHGYPYNDWDLTAAEAQFLTQAAVFGAMGVNLYNIENGMHSPYWIWNHTWGDGSFEDGGTISDYGNFKRTRSLISNAESNATNADKDYLTYWTPDDSDLQRMITPVLYGNLSIAKTVTNGTGSLVISKTTSGTAADKAKEFTFTLVVKNASGKVQNEDYSYTGSKSGKISGKNGTVKLKDGQKITVSGIPAGYSWTVTETADANYTTTPANRTRTGTIPSVGTSADSFTFKVTFSDGGTYSYTGSASGSIKSGKTLNLKGGQKITIHNIPAGVTYSVTEGSESGYKTTSSGTSGTIALSTTRNAAFTNTYNPANSSAAFTNTRNTSSVEIVKTTSATGTANSQLSGNAMYSQDFSGAVFSVQVWDAANSKWGTATTHQTGTDGKVLVDGLHQGDKVRITETKAPKGYLVPSPASQEITLAAGKNTATFKDAPTFDPGTPVIKKVKYTGGKIAAGETVAGAVFKTEYYDNTNCSGTPKRTWYFKTGSDGTFVYSRSALADGYTSSDLYVDTFNVPELPLGSVKFTEVKTPKGYMLYEGDVRGKITQNSTTGLAEFSWITASGGQILVSSDGTATVGNKELAVAVDKVDSSTLRSVSGAVLQLKEGSTVLSEWTTSGSEKVLKGILEPGKTYVLHEKSAPENYTVAEDIRFEVAADGTITVLSGDPDTYTTGEGFLGIKMKDIKKIRLPLTGSDDLLILLLIGSLLFGGGAGAAAYFLKKKKGNGKMLKKMTAALVGLITLAGAASPVFAAGNLAVTSEDPQGHAYTAYQLLSGTHLGDETLWDIHVADDIPDTLWDRLEVSKEARASTEIAEWFAESVRNDSDGSFAVKVAKAVLAESSIGADGKLRSGEETELPDGYYLVVSDDAQPMLLLIGNGETLTIQEKSSVPTMEKEIGEVAPDGKVTYGKAADSGLDKPVPYRITGTLPSNYNAYDSYTYCFKDTYDVCLVIDPASVRVHVADKEGKEKDDITKKAKITVGKTEMSVDFKNLMDAYPVYTEGDVLVVDYTVTITDEALIGSKSNDNEAWIEYTRSPTCDQLGKSVPDRCRLYTWELDLSKIAEDTKEALKGAGFTILDDAGRFVNTDGTRTEKQSGKSVWTTDGKGRFETRRIDSGVYTVTEVEAPEGYKSIAPFTVTIRADYAKANSVSLTAKTKGSGVEVKTVDAKTGIVLTEVSDIPDDVPPTGDKANLLPLIILLAVSGGGIVAGTILIRRKKRK